MSDNKSQTIAVKLPFPKIVCDDCLSVCVYHKDTSDSGSEPWLQCTGCGKQWPNTAAAVEKQDCELDNINDAIRELSAFKPNALDRLQRLADKLFAGRVNRSGILPPGLTYVPIEPKEKAVDMVDLPDSSEAVALVPNHPVQPLVTDKDGIVRFKANAIVRFLLDRGSIDLNQLACTPFSQEDWVQFAQLIGYSLCGFGDLPYVDDDHYERASTMKGEQPCSR